MRRFLICLTVVCISTWAIPALAPGGSTTRVPILVVLFTSEGCSDCPPADAFLEKLDRQPFQVAEMIVLSEHVDYWNHDGWKDPYSSHFYSERQAAYARRFFLPSVYTPQMIVDGTSEFVGSNQAAAGEAFAKAANTTKVGVRMSSISIDSANNLMAHIETNALPDNQKADVYVAIALNHADSQVSAGENAGRKLSHTAVVRLISKVGSVEKGQPYAQEIHMKLPPDVSPSNLRIVSFVQQAQQGKVFGAAMRPLGTESH